MEARSIQSEHPSTRALWHVSRKLSVHLGASVLLRSHSFKRWNTFLCFSMNLGRQSALAIGDHFIASIVAI
jgi:hypothetical protein